MNISDVFRKCDGITGLTYADFKPIGWNANDYFIYMRFCEEIRSAVIMSPFLKKAEGIRLLNGEKLEESVINQRVQALFDWLQQFSDKELPEPKGAAMWLVTFRTYDNHAVFRFDHEVPNPGLIYYSQSRFTVCIESFIRQTIFGEELIDFSPVLEDREQLSEQDLKRKIKDLQFEIDHTEEPVFPEDLDSYLKITWWAQKQARFNDISDIEDELDEYKELLEKKRVPDFNPARSVLYIYRWGNIICKKDSHDIANVNCIIPTLDGEGTINAQFCRDCRKFIISETSYEHYLKDYKLLPVRMSYVNNDGTFPKSLYSTDRADKSPLFLAGYNVSSAKGLTTRERQGVLKLLMDEHAIEKYDIISYLEMFINTNGRNANMKNAILKWREDLSFVLEYNMENQDTYEIMRIEQY